MLVGCSLSPRSRMTRPPSTSAKRPHCCVHPQQVTRFSATASAPLRPPNATLDQAVGRNRVGSPVHELRVSVRGTALPSPDIPPIEARGRVSSVRAHCGAQRQRESSRRCHVPRRVDRKRFGEGREDLDRPARAEAWQRAVVVVPSLRRLPQSAPGCGADKLLQIDFGATENPANSCGHRASGPTAMTGWRLRREGDHPSPQPCRSPPWSHSTSPALPPRPAS